MEIRIELKNGTAIELDCVDAVEYGRPRQGIVSISHPDGIEDYKIDDIKEFEIVEKSRDY